MTRLHEFAKAGNSKAIKKDIKNYREYTLDIVSEVNKKDQEGRTPLFIATERNDMKTMNVLLSVEGIDVNSAGNNNISPLHAAVKNNNIKAVYALLTRGANVDAEDMKGNTPLFYAVDCVINTKFSGKTKATDILELLLLKRANLNIQNKQGNTPLHLAAKNDNVKLLQILLRFDAVVETENNNGITSLELAALNRNNIMAAILAKQSVSEKLADLKGQHGNAVKKLDGLDKILKKINKKIMKDILRISRKVIGVNLGGVTELSLNKLQSILFPLPVSDHPSSAPLLYNPTSIISISPLSTHNAIEEKGDANNLTTKTLLISQTIDWNSLNLIYDPVTKIARNDNCFYQAVSRHVRDKSPTALRVMVADCLRNSPHLFSQINAFAAVGNITSYIDDIENGTVPANDQHIEILMGLLDRPLVIIDSDEKSVKFVALDLYKGKPILLCHSDNHYDALHGYIDQELIDNIRAHFVEVRSPELLTVNEMTMSPILPVLQDPLLKKKKFSVSPVIPDPQQTQPEKSTALKAPIRRDSLMPSSSSSPNSSKPTMPSQSNTQQAAKIEVPSMQQFVPSSSDTNLMNNRQPLLNTTKPENHPKERTPTSQSSSSAKILSNINPKVEPIGKHKHPIVVKGNVKQLATIFSNSSRHQQVKKPEVINASGLVQGAHKENDSSRVIDASRKLR